MAGSEPYAEDGWRTIRIGTVHFEVAKPCARCATTTVDQASGVRGVEPLRTLATYRRQGSGVMFGQNIAHHTTGTLHVGDDLEVMA
ncbi:MAG: MOSC domain-containing protein [Gemmatimonadaceae bacterium]